MPKQKIERVRKNTNDTTLCTQSYYAKLTKRSPSAIHQAIEYGHLETVTVLGGLRLIKLN